MLFKKRQKKVILKLKHNGYKPTKKKNARKQNKQNKPTASYLPSHTFALPLHLPPSRTSDQLLCHIAGTPPPLLAMTHASVDTAINGRVHHFLPSSTRIELCVHTLLTTNSRRFLQLFFFYKNSVPRRGSNSRKSTTVIVRLNY